MSSPIEVLRETHDCPPEVRQRITRAGGVNLYGQPNFRVVWGWNRLTLIGGKWEDSGRVEMRRVPKYFWPAHNPNRWYLEKWCAPEMYGNPATWLERTSEVAGASTFSELGPFPSEGEYEHCYTLEGPAGEFVQLTPEVVERLVRLVQHSRQFSFRERKAALRAREEQKGRQQENRDMDILNDALGPFAGGTQLHTFVPSQFQIG